MLGNITSFTINTPDLETSFEFYKKLGFKETMRDSFPFPWIQISDGAILIMLRKDNEPYIALTYYAENFEDTVKMLEQQGITFTLLPKPTDMIKRYRFQSPDGLNISLVSMPGGFKQPEGPTMLKMPQEDYFNPEKYVNKTIGLYGEFAHPVTNLEQSFEFWKNLGFDAVSKFEAPYPWAIISDGLAVVGLHQSTMLSKPAITYFASDMKDKIAALKENGIAGIEMGDSNTVLTSPEGQYINLFKLGM